MIVWQQKCDGEKWESQVIQTTDKPQWRVSWSEMGNILAVSGAGNEVSCWFATGLRDLNFYGGGDASARGGVCLAARSGFWCSGQWL